MTSPSRDGARTSSADASDSGSPAAVRNSSRFVPVIGLGGIADWRDAAEFIMTGASAVQVGTATFANPRAMEDIVDGLAAFMARKGYRDLASMRGLALL